MLKILFISDIHYSTHLTRGAGESKRFDWLYSLVKAERPELLISGGDFGEEAARQHFQPILEMTPVLTVYGNHDNLELIKNLRNFDGTRCWLEDGTVTEFSGIRIAGISGNLAVRKRKPHHKTFGDIEEVIQRYAGAHIDILVTHEVPTHPSFARGGQERGYIVFNKAFEMLRPRIYLTGHTHFNSSSLETGKTLLVNVDSSLRRNQYATIYSQGGFRVEIHEFTQQRTP